MRDMLEPHWHDAPMNRIREIREAAGLTSEELGNMIGTSSSQILRLEKGERRLTVEWMQKIAEALKCTPADLIATAAVAEVKDEVEPVQMDAVARAIADKGLLVYRVTGRSVIRVGIAPGDVITVDTTQAAIDALKGMEVVVAEIGAEKSKVLRQFLPPDMLYQNRSGSNMAVSLSDPVMQPRILGVVLRGG